MNYFIVPAWSDQGGQCRIVSTPGPKINDPLAHYRKFPDLWSEAGLMNSRGELVYLSGPMSHAEELRSCEPLMAGTTFYLDPK